MIAPLAADGRAVVVAIDHGLYSWPVPGLEDRAGLVAAVCEARRRRRHSQLRTLRACRDAFAGAARVPRARPHDGHARRLFEATENAIDAGAAGVAYGRNVWGSADPTATVRRLVEVVHGDRG